MDAKWIFAAGVGAGAALALRLSEKQIGEIKRLAAEVYQSPSIHAAKRVTTDKITEKLRERGAQVVDKLADNLKQNLFTDPSSNMSTASTIDNDGYVIIDGKKVH